MTDTTWLHRKPGPHVAPLTDPTIKAWIETGALTAYGYPTRAQRVQRIWETAIVLFGLAAVAAVFTYSMWK